MEAHLHIPIRFKPILKDKVWGGGKLHELLNKPSGSRCGESWELSAVPGDVSVVSGGPFDGMTLEELQQQFGVDLMGEKGMDHGKDGFPLLFKFIDAKEDLSVQLHPDDALPQKRHQSLGKTEMWYVMQADPGARLILGFDQPTTSETYLKYLHEGRLTELLAHVPVKAGDAFFISPGTVHAIGGGVMLAEIQQTSDVTYRLYDWDRPDVDGSYRELHTEQALDVIRYGAFDGQLHKGEDGLLCRSDYFVTHLLEVEGELGRPSSERRSFHVYMGVEGQSTIHTEGGSLELHPGQTVLVPAAARGVRISASKASILEVYLP